MTRFDFVYVFIIATYFNVILNAEEVAEDFQEHNVKERPVGRSYSLTTCDYRTQIGYTCLSCTRALHCYIGNVAILVDCYGPLRYCRDGRCSRHQGEKCADNKATTLGPFNTTIQTDAASLATNPTTKIATGVTESVVAAVTETVNTTIDEKSTTKGVTTVAQVDEKATTKSEGSTTTAVNISSNIV